MYKALSCLAALMFSMDAFRFMKKEPDRYRAKVVYAIMEQLDAINTFLHEFKSLPETQKDT